MTILKPSKEIDFLKLGTKQFKKKYHIVDVKG
jgi:hypothetical protein